MIGKKVIWSTLKEKLVEWGTEFFSPSYIIVARIRVSRIREKAKISRDPISL